MTTGRKLEIILNRAFPIESGIVMNVRYDVSDEAYIVEIFKGDEFQDDFSINETCATKMIELDEENDI